MFPVRYFSLSNHNFVKIQDLKKFFFFNLLDNLTNSRNYLNVTVTQNYHNTHISALIVILAIQNDPSEITNQRRGK